MATVDENDGVDTYAPDGKEYYGYEPKSPQDFPFDEDVPLEEHERHEVDPNMLRDQGRTSKALLLGAGFLVLSTIVLGIWFFLIGGAGTCKVAQLCDTRDRTSYVSESEVPRNFEFLVPTKLLWVAMVSASFGLFVASCHALGLLRKRVGTLAMAEFSNRVRQSTQFFFARVLLLVAVPFVLMFILVGVGPGWRVAGGFAIGFLLSLTTCFLTSKVSFAGNSRVSGAALENVALATKLGLRTGSVMGLVVVGLGLVGISATYLMFEDVRAVAGFAFGASVVSLAARLGGGMFAKAADIGADSLLGSSRINSEDHPENPAVVADVTGDVVGSILGGTAESSATFAASIAATAMLGSSLPFFQRNQFAMCVFNHLYVDNRCGQFGYPQQLSHASFICKTDDFYLQYPRLSVWQSNALFVALPFLLASVGLLASVVATAKFHVPSDTTSAGEGEAAPRNRFRTAHANSVLSAVLVIAGSAALCFSLFGGNSTFQDAAGLGPDEGLPTFKLSGDENACVNTFLQTGDSAATLPSGDFSNSGHYKPSSTLGFEFGEARWTAWRLFACILIGVVLGQVTDFIAAYYTMAAYPPMQAAERSEKYGTGPYVVQVLGAGMMSTVVPMVLTAAAVLSTYNLFGFYGIALCSVALLSSAGIHISTSALATFADVAAGTLRSCRRSLPGRMEDSAAAMSAVAAVSQPLGGGAYNVAALFTACGILAALVNESGLTPSSRDLVGTPRILGRVLQSASTLADTYVIASMFIGFCVPFIVTGLLLISVHTIARSVVVDFKQAAAEDAAHGRQLVDGGAHDRYKAVVHSLTRSSLLAVVLPFSGAFLAPLIVGYGFGQRALVGVLVATVAASYLLATAMAHAGGLWAVAKRISGDAGGRGGACGAPASALRRDAVRSGDVVGDVFQNAAAPSLNAYAVAAALAGLVAVPTMQPDGRDGWVGAVLLLAAVLLGVAYAAWWARAARRGGAAGGGGDDAGVCAEAAPARRVSPFYERGTAVARDAVAPGSQMHDAMRAAGAGPRVGDAARLPGLADRDAIDRERLAAARAT